MKYKEGFSRALVSELIDSHDADDVLDPFAGVGTTPLTASGQGKQATGIEIMPVGILAGQAISEASNGLSAPAFDRECRDMLHCIRSGSDADNACAFPHVPITMGAFSEETEHEIAIARGFLAKVENATHRLLLNFACMSVLEETSYTRKDGQYLRWDRRSSRTLRSGVHKGPIPSFGDALAGRFADMIEDAPQLKVDYGQGRPRLIEGSCLELLKDIPSSSFDMVITSPPYANRYDYTRTYALELAWLDHDRDAFSRLRQQLLSATVENRQKTEWMDALYGSDRTTLDHALGIHAGQGALQEVLAILNECKDELSNRNVIRLIDQYLLEMAVVISELGRVVRPGGVVVMVNDNVQYHGEELPVDLILSDFAEQSGFECKNIWKLARGKGNSSQQMARYGRQEIRKCVYRWVRSGD